MTRHRQEGERGREGGRKGEGARRRRSERRLWRGTGGLALWNALKGREQLSLSLFLSRLELPVGCEAKKREKAKEEEGLSGTVLLQLITTLSSGRPALDVPPGTVIYGRPAASLDLISYVRFRPRER